MSNYTSADDGSRCSSLPLTLGTGRSWSGSCTCLSSAVCFSCPVQATSTSWLHAIILFIGFWLLNWSTGHHVSALDWWHHADTAGVWGSLMQKHMHFRRNSPEIQVPGALGKFQGLTHVGIHSPNEKHVALEAAPITNKDAILDVPLDIWGNMYHFGFSP